MKFGILCKLVVEANNFEEANKKTTDELSKSKVIEFVEIEETEELIDKSVKEFYSSANEGYDSLRKKEESES